MYWGIPPERGNCAQKYAWSRSLGSSLAVYLRFPFRRLPSCSRTGHPYWEGGLASDRAVTLSTTAFPCLPLAYWFLYYYITQLSFRPQFKPIVLFLFTFPFRTLVPSSVCVYVRPLWFNALGRPPVTSNTLYHVSNLFFD